MSNEAQITELDQLVQDIIAEDADLFLVNIRIKPTNNVRVYIDGDNGVGIGKLSKINRALYKRIEEEAIFPGGDFSLEVSSPGIDEPLRLKRQYRKNIGRYAEVILLDGSKIEGKLTAANEEAIVLEEEKGKNRSGRQGSKKKEIVQHTILFNNIKTTTIQIKF